MKNEFLLHLKHPDINEQDKVFKHLISKEEFHADLVSEKILKNEKEAFYRILISPLSLIQLKRTLDKESHYDLLELFEFKIW
jgi:hypothetical protein